MKSLKINVPEGYEIDKENSTFECIKFKPIKKKRWRDDGNALIEGYLISFDSKIFKTTVECNNIYKNYNIFVTEKQLNLLERVAEKLKNGLITSGNVSHTSIVQGYTIENVVNNIKEILQKEPVSDELEEAAKRYATEEYNRKSPATLSDRCRGCYAPLMYAFKAGANWQKEQMMAKAINGGCFSYKNGFIHISCDIDEHITNIKFGDKVKVIVIKD